MKYLLNKESSIKAIANAIRSKTGSTGNLSVADMPEAINSISGGSGGVHTININGDNCNTYRFDMYSVSTGSFVENGDQGFAEAIEYFSAGYQVNIHLSCENNTYDAVVTNVYDFDEEVSFSGEYYPMVAGPCFIANTVIFDGYEYICKAILFVTNDGNLTYGST